ncbi:MAG: RHS repeat-associated core domain-containing protein, partial [Eubacterium sp.]|nr:RHS repeat-associated core domain-containing protein [Eubacterium sp.]
INYELTGYINDINTEYTQTLMEFGANGNTTNIYEYGDGRNSAIINGTKGYYLYDGRGSVAGLTGSNSGSMITYRYDAYGNTTKSNNTLNNPYQYNAEYTDSSTGLQYLRARYYDSSQGRFTTKDSVYGFVELPITFNPYTYVCNNPLNLIDPSGRFFKQIFGTVAGVAKGTYGAGKALFTGGSVKQGWKSGYSSGYSAGSKVGAKWDNKVTQTRQDARDLAKFTGYYIKTTSKYYANEAEKWLRKTYTNGKTKLEAKADEWKAAIQKHLCDKADRIVAQQEAQDMMQLQQYEAMKQIYDNRTIDGNKEYLFGKEFGDSEKQGGYFNAYVGYSETDTDFYKFTQDLTQKDYYEDQQLNLIGLSTEIDAVKLEGGGMLGDENQNLHVKGEGSALSVNGDAKLNIGSKGLEAQIGGMASALNGSITLGGTSDW